MKKIENQFVWTEAYRPQTVDDCILPNRIKEIFNGFVTKGSSPNLLLYGKSGVGKTTIAKAMLNEMGCNVLFINASKEKNIETLNNDVANFASSVSFIDGKRKYVILDEADWLNPNSTQPALRAFMETYSSNCGFILTCNYKNKIMKEIHSRCSLIDFKINKTEMASLATQFMKLAMAILDNEKIEYNKTVLAELISMYMPDWRRCLNELDSYSSRNGKIDSGIIANSSYESFTELVKLLKEKNYTGIRVWVTANSHNDVSTLLRDFYDHSVHLFTPRYIPEIVLLINNYQYKAAFVMDQEINICAFLTEVLATAEWL